MSTAVLQHRILAYGNRFSPHDRVTLLYCPIDTDLLRRTSTVVFQVSSASYTVSLSLLLQLCFATNPTTTTKTRESTKRNVVATTYRGKKRQSKPRKMQRIMATTLVAQPYVLCADQDRNGTCAKDSYFTPANHSTFVFDARKSLAFFLHTTYQLLF